MKRCALFFTLAALVVTLGLTAPADVKCKQICADTNGDGKPDTCQQICGGN